MTSRVLAVLGCFDGDHRSLSLSEIAHRSALPVSTTHRLVGELTAGALLERTESGSYTVGLKLWELGAASVRAARLHDVAMPFLQDLYEATHENVHLAIRDGADVLYVAKLNGLHSVLLTTRVGRRLHWHTTGVGKAVVAYEPADVIDSLLAQPLHRRTSHTLTDPGRMRVELSNVRERGYALSNEEHALGTFSVAAPIFGADRTPLAAVAVTLHSSRASVKKLAPTVRAVSLGVTRTLAT